MDIPVSIPPEARRTLLLERYREDVRKVYVLMVVSAVIAVSFIAVALWMANHDGSVLIGVGPIALGLVGVLLGPQRLQQLKRERDAALAAVDAQLGARPPV